MTRTPYTTIVISSLLAYMAMSSGNRILMAVFIPIAFIGMFAGMISIWIKDNEKKKEEFKKRPGPFQGP